jgi:hypothetical protein
VGQHPIHHSLASSTNVSRSEWHSCCCSAPSCPRHDNVFGILGVGMDLYQVLAAGAPHLEAPNTS